MPAIQHADGFAVAAVCSGSLTNAQAAAEVFNAGCATDDFDELLGSDGVDVVVIATPPALHRPMTLAALEAGKHVICEKPMALTVAEAEEMAAVAAAAGTVSVIDHEQRYLPSNRQFHRLVADGYLGELRYLDVRVCLPLTTDASLPFASLSWRDDVAGGGGLLSGIFSHYIDLMCLSFGDVASVAGFLSTAVTSKPFPVGSGQEGHGPVTTDDCVAASGVLENGAPFSLSGSWSIHHGVSLRVGAYGSEGTLMMSGPDRLLGARAGEAEVSPIESQYPLPDGTEGHVGAFVHLLDDVAAVLEGHEASGHYATFDDGVVVQRVIDTIRSV